MSGPIQRTMTLGEAFMDPKANVFNSSINSNRRVWESLISTLISGLININKPILKTSTCTIVNVENRTNVESIEPMVYYLGGSGYASYNRLITENGGEDIFDKAPRTHDWDTSFVLSRRDNSLLDESHRFIITTLQNLYSQLNTNNYLQNNFEEINKKPELEHGEKLLGIFGPKDHEVIEVSYLEDRKKTYQNIRLNLVKKVGDTFEKNHIIECLFWFKKPMQDYIKKTVRLIFPDVTYYIPTPIDLIKSNLISLINRSTNPQRLAKCRQDFMRVKSFIDKINIVRVFIPELVEDLSYVNLFLDKIHTYIPQCMDKLEESTFVLITENLKTKGKKNILVKKLQELLAIDYNYFIIRFELERDIQKISTTEHLKEELEDSNSQILTLEQLEKIEKAEEETNYFKQKYLKYKQKYLNKNN